MHLGMFYQFLQHPYSDYGTACAAYGKNIFLHRLFPDFFKNLLRIFPYKPFVLRISQEIRRMECRHQRNTFKLIEFAPQFAYRNLQPDKRLRRYAAQRNYNLRRDYLCLFSYKWRTGLNLVFLGVSVERRPAFHDIADIDILSPKSHLLYQPCEQLSCLAYKRPPLNVLVFAWTFANEHYFCINAAFSEDNVLPSLKQLAPLTIADLIAKRLQRI